MSQKGSFSMPVANNLSPAAAGHAKECCPSGTAAERIERRGTAWVMAAFLICPCHLPITLWAVATVLAGTGAGLAIRQHPAAAGIVITAAWLSATWHGFRLVRRASKMRRQ
jgi:hypothetical protein